MRNGILLVMLSVIIFCFLSCTKRKNDNVVRLVEEWRKKEIIFPEDVYFTLYGKDTVQYPKHQQYTIVSYVDSAGCFSCKLRLPTWREFIHLLDSVFPGKVSVLMFLHSKNEIELSYTLKKNGFGHPVCIDENDKLNRLNHFPSDMAFQTFLLDKDNKVLAMGNPILNPKVKELYLNIIQGKTTTKEENAILTKIQVKENTISLGRFNWQEEQKAQFVIYNVGKRPLVINDVTTSCGCTSVDYSKQPVSPGDSISLQVNYKADHPEHFDKTITVYCNTDPSLIQLKITGDAE